MRRVLHPCLLILVALVAACAPTGAVIGPPQASLPPAPPAVLATRTPVPPPPPVAAGAPYELTARLQAIGLGFEGRVGIAVHDLQAGWTTGYNLNSLLPQQSVSKLWVAVSVLDAVDRGALRLDDPVTVGLGDLSVFNQPIRDKLVAGLYSTNVGDLMVMQIAQSDNAANDILMRRAGGPEVVQRTIADKRLGAIRGGPEEKVLQSRIAALDWRPEYSFGLSFWTARDRVDPAVRAAALNAYLADPDDGATPTAMVEGLARLKKGELLSPPSTARLLDIMAQTSTGPMRLRAGLAPGWTISHKTGTGQDLADLSTGYNDVGLVTAPDGHCYAVAVMIASTRRPVPERQAMMASVAAAVVALHDGRDPNVVMAAAQ